MILISDLLFWTILGVNSLIGYCLYKDLKEAYKEKKRKEKRIKNLLGETLEIEMTEEESEILQDLSKGNRKRYLREKIIELCRE